MKKLLHFILDNWITDSIFSEFCIGSMLDNKESFFVNIFPIKVNKTVDSENWFTKPLFSCFFSVVSV